VSKHMKSIADEWSEFERRCIPAGAGIGQRFAMRRAFYAGVVSTLGLTLDATDIAGDDDDKGAMLLDGLMDECKVFHADMLAGRV